MQLATCWYQGTQRLARAEDGGLRLLDRKFGTSLRDLLGARALASVDSDRGGEWLRLAEIEFLTPIPDAEKILCVGMNYRGHLTETAAALPKYPSLFARFNSSQVGHDRPVIAPSNSAEFDFEGELAVIIGTPAWRVSEKDALDVVAGYSCFAENSVRDFQNHARQATAGKNFVASGAMGPWLTTADEVPDPSRLELTTRLNGEVVQQTSVSEMVFTVQQLIEYITRFTRLMPGDVISTGTPDGVGFLRKPPLWLQPGDMLEIDIPGVGLLRNKVIAEADSLPTPRASIT